MNDELERRFSDLGRKYRAMLEGPDGLAELFRAVEANYLKTLIETPVEASVEREAIYHRINALKDVQRGIEAIVRQGQVSDKLLSEAAKREEKQRRKAKTT
jgi:sRNA-binding carbon storage regulator CsrA